MLIERKGKSEAVNALPMWHEEHGWQSWDLEVKVLGGLSMLMLKCLRMMTENEVDRESVSQVVKFLRSMTTAQSGALLHQEG